MAEPISSASGVHVSIAELLTLAGSFLAVGFVAWKFIFGAVIRKVRMHDTELALHAERIGKMVTHDEFTNTVANFSTKLDETDRRRNDQFESLDRRGEERIDRVVQTFRADLQALKGEVIAENAKEGKGRHDLANVLAPIPAAVAVIAARTQEISASVARMTETVVSHGQDIAVLKDRKERDHD